MLTEGQPTEVVAFHPDLNSSLGTANMVWQAEQQGLPVRVITGEGVH